MTVRVRFAPSPTGPLHIGGVRTALYNYLFAKKHNGTFILRIEDTDQNRYVPGAEEYIIEAMNWLGIPFDEGVGSGGELGPYRQSERKAMYRQYADRLIENGWGYYAFDTAESLANLRKQCESEKKTFVYNHLNRNALENSLSLSPEEVQARIDSGTPYVVRFKMPVEELHMVDEIRGHITQDTGLLDDKILFKSDGMPTYHLANIVDDHTMEITHVIRGEEWLPSMPLHVLLYRAFGWEPPKFAHLPLIMKPVGKGKLSKRDGDKMGFPVFPLRWTDPKSGSISAGYREDGYLPEAVLNMLALLGWNEGNDREMYSLSDLIDAFSLARVSKSGAKFNPQKTKWFNQQYLQNYSDEDLALQFAPIVKEKCGQNPSAEFLTRVVHEIRARATFVHEFWDLGAFFFVAPTEFDAKASKKQWKTTTNDIMAEVCTLLEGMDVFDSASLSTRVKGWIVEQGHGFGKVMQPMRLSLVGAPQGPDIFDIAEMLGKEETINRIQYAMQTLKK
ncbi:MAG: glutamate--tRNA ligase [Deltaproteobacteria bacterium]|nr:glutamate--tRNA ligase [Deltaproteobacteria bacterium]